MCGRSTHKLSWKQIVELYPLTLPEQPPENFVGESHNVAPTHVMPIVRPQEWPRAGERSVGTDPLLVEGRRAIILDHQCEIRSHRDGSNVPRGAQDTALHNPDYGLVRMAGDRHQDQAAFLSGLEGAWKSLDRPTRHATLQYAKRRFIGGVTDDTLAFT